MSKQAAPTASPVGHCPAISQISRMPQHWKFIQYHHNTQTPLAMRGTLVSFYQKKWKW